MERTISFGRSISAIRTRFNISGKLTGQGRNIAGLVTCVTLFCLGFAIHGNMGMYFNLSGLVIVIGGTMGATLVSFRMEQLVIVYKVLKGSYRPTAKKIDDIVEILVDLSVKSKIRGVLSLQEDEEEISVLFLRQGLKLLVDGYPVAHIRDILNTEMYFFKLRREDSERVLRSMGEICPAFGLVGSVVGLIGMLAGVGDTAVIMTTVPIALTSTLYGVIFSNFFFFPFAANIKERTDQELILQKIIMEGIIAIGSDLHPRLLETRLKSFLTPSARHGRIVSLKRIKEKYNIKAASSNL